MLIGTLTNSPKIFGILTAVLKNNRITKYQRSILLIAASSLLLAGLAGSPEHGAQPGGGHIAIGQVQGSGNQSAYLGQTVQLRGIATGMREDENARGARFHTVFIQDLPGGEDGNPETSDGIPVFFGPSRPPIEIGDVLNVSGVVTEFYGLTEIDFRDLSWAIDGRNHPLPEPIELDPPVDNRAAETYYEYFEGMLVKLPRSTVVGPTHAACGFAVVRYSRPPFRVFKHHIDEPGGQVINVLHRTDVTCDSFPLVNFGDEIEGISGPLTYHFEQFKIIQQDPLSVTVTNQPNVTTPQIGQLEPDQISLATFNLGNYFDSTSDTNTEAEPILDSVDLRVKNEKLAYTIANSLACPTLIAVQEVEHYNLLSDLAEMLLGGCNFRYDVTHEEAPDLRGSDLALLSDPRHVLVTNVFLQQTCTALETGVIDSNINCPSGTQPLFSRPPLQVDVLVDGVPMAILVNHLKSKRGGEIETFERRMAQVKHLQTISRALLREDRELSIAALGDFNDYYQSPIMEELTDGGYLLDALFIVPEEERYSYIFDGYSQLIDWIVVSPSLMSKLISAQIVHVNSDFHYDLSDKIGEIEIAHRSSDHDIPLVILQMVEARDQPPEITPTIRATSFSGPQPAPTRTIEVNPTLTVEMQETRIATSDPTPDIHTVNPSIDRSSGKGEKNPHGAEFRIGLLLLVAFFAAGLAAFIWNRGRT